MIWFLIRFVTKYYKMKLAVVGITGMVGQEMINVLEEMNFQIDEFIPVASQRSIGKKIEYNGSDYEVIGMEDAVKLKSKPVYILKEEPCGESEESSQPWK